MPALSWTEICQRAFQFSRDWRDETEEQAGQVVLGVCQKFLDVGITLADLYDPFYMPAELLKAHQSLDAVVDKAYRGVKFHSERERVEFLFELYNKLTAPLVLQESNKRKKRTPES